VDLTASIGFIRADAVESNRKALHEILRYGRGYPIVLFGNKTDLTFAAVWAKTKDIYMQFVFNRRDFVSAAVDSQFAQCPREVTLSILYMLAALLRYSKAGNNRDCTDEYIEMAREFGLPILFGSALYNEGVDEVFERVLEEELRFRQEAGSQ
jgi:hypothetical protein